MYGFANTEKDIILVSAFETGVFQDDGLNGLKFREKIVFLGLIIKKVEYDLLLKGIDFGRFDIEFKLYFFKPVIRRF